MIFGYARVSTTGQAKDGNSLEAQTALLKEHGAKAIFCDSISGAKASRPELDKLMERVKKGDTVLVSKLDRLSRSLTDGISLIDRLQEKGVVVSILNLGVLDNTITGKLIRNVLLSVAEFERGMIQERTAEGKAVARLNPNYREGRPKKYTPEQIAHAMELLENHSYSQVVKMTGISKTTLLRSRRNS